MKIDLGKPIVIPYFNQKYNEFPLINHVKFPTLTEPIIVGSSLKNDIYTIATPVHNYLWNHYHKKPFAFT